MESALQYPLFTERNFKNNSSHTTTKSSNLDNTRQVFLVYLFWISLFFKRQKKKNPNFTLGTCLEKKKRKRKTHTH